MSRTPRKSERTFTLDHPAYFQQHYTKSFIIQIYIFTANQVQHLFLKSLGL